MRAATPSAPRAHVAPLDVALESRSPSVRQLLVVLHAHAFDSALNVKSLRARCSLRDHNVSCRFKHEMGVSIQTYLERLRIEKASELLLNSGLSVAVIAHAVGYAHLQTFYAAYSRQRDGTPGARRAPPPAATAGRLAPHETCIAAQAASNGTGSPFPLSHLRWMDEVSLRSLASGCVDAVLAALDESARYLMHRSWDLCTPHERGVVLTHTRLHDKLGAEQRIRILVDISYFEV